MHFVIGNELGGHLKLAQRMSRIRPSATVAMTEAAAKWREDGLETYALSVGESDFETPEHIREAAKAAIDSGKTRYTASDGLPALKTSIANKLRNDFNLDYQHSEIIVTSGGKMAIFEALLASVEQDDEVIIVAPYWVSYPDIVRFAGATPVIVHARHEDGYKLPLAAIEAAVNENTRWLILNSPNNPTGAVIGANEYEMLAKLLEIYPQLNILSDDIYEYLTYDGRAPAHILNTAPQLKNRVLLINGVSKSYAMTGWRIGYAAGHSELIKAMRILQAQSTNNPSSIAQYAAIAALDGSQEFLINWCEEYQKRRDFVMARLAQNPKLKPNLPEGAFYVFVNIEAFLGGDYADDIAFATALLAENGVATVPGSAFGAPGAIRISFANNIDYLDAAMQKLLEFVGGIRV